MKDVMVQTIHLLEGEPESKKAEIKSYFEQTFEQYEKLYNLVKNDAAFYKKADPLRHPLIFYLGHTAVFFMNKLMLAGIVKERINPYFESIFAIGVDEMSWDDLDENHYDWPDLSEVWAYRQKVKEKILHIINHTQVELPIDWESSFWIVMMGIEHERIHLETSSVLIRQLPIEDVVQGAFGEVCMQYGEAPKNSLVQVKGGEITLGKDQPHAYYGWDNEYGKHTEKVEPFKAGKMLVSNGDFKKFVDDGGYHNKNYWTEEGWSWCTYKNAKNPLFWKREKQDYELRLVDRIIPMPWNWPVEVNYLEAKAYANWLTEKQGENYRLPTEAEWYKLALDNGLKDEPVMATKANINLEHYYSPAPVDTFKMGNFFDVAGNVWQWTETPITGFPGFKVHPLYDDFSTPTFDGKHNIMKGGSWISTGNEATFHSRYAFRRHFYQHAGFRVIQSDAPLNIREDSYEYDEEIAISCEMNYGQPVLGLDNFSAQLAKIGRKLIKNKPDSKVVDMNCNTGRTVFELAPYAKEVTGLDCSARFIKMAINMQSKGFVRYVTTDENELEKFNEVHLQDLGLQVIDNVQFMQTDANNIKPTYTGYDLLIAANLLEELYNPIEFLATIHERINDQGFLLCGSTYNWSKVSRELWPGGFKEDGEPVSSFNGIKRLLSKHFKLVQEPLDLKFTVPYSSRKTEVRTSQISVWQKRNNTRTHKTVNGF